MISALQVYEQKIRPFMNDECIERVRTAIVDVCMYAECIVSARSEILAVCMNDECSTSVRAEDPAVHE